MPAIYMPDGDAPQAALGVVTTLDSILASMRQGVAVLYHEHAGARAYLADDEATGLRLELTPPKRVKGRMQATIRWTFCTQGRQNAWRGKLILKVSTPLFARDSIDLLHGQMAQSCLSIDPAEFDRDLALLEQALRVLLRADNLDRFIIGSEACSVLGANPTLPQALAPLLREMRKDLAASVASEKARRAALRRAFKSLPGGTPLAVWTQKTGTWQLGVKSDSASMSTIRNSAILPPDILKDPRLREAGLSAHVLLPLLPAAEAALRDHPAFAQTDLPQKHAIELARMSKASRFHESWIEVKQRPVAVAYVSTRPAPYGYAIFKVHGDEPPRRKCSWGDDKIAPPFAATGADPVELKAVRPVEHQRIAKPGFYRLGGLLCVRDEVIDVLSQHHLQDITLVPTLLRDEDGTLLAGRWAHIAVDKGHSALVDRGHTPTGMHFPMPDKAWTLRLDPHQIGAADMWWDDTISGQPYFFSPRLLQALRRIKAPPPLALKPCLAA